MRNMSFDIFALRKKVAVRLLLKSLIWAFALLGFLVALFLVAVIFWRPSSAVEVPESAVLTINLDRDYGEIKNDSLLADFGAVSSMSFSDLLSILNAAAFDDRIKAIAARIHSSDFGMAQKQELYQAILNFRAKGKKTYIFAPGFGNFGGGTSEYYLASAFDEITMLPNTDLGLTGVGIEVPFARALLDKIGITPEFYARYEYKTGMVSFTDKKASSAFCENMLKLLGSINFSLLNTSMKGRYTQSTREDVFSFVNKAPFTADYALNKGLIDRIAYEGDWIEEIKSKHNAKEIGLYEYASNVYWPMGKRKIGVIVIDGTIVDNVSGLFGEKEISSAQILSTVDELMKENDLAGVLVRIDSPGGSYAASNEIWHALVKLKEKKKVPLFVSMGNYAASGGYFAALAGDKIFASETTVTGSIGVFGGKFVLEDLWKKLDVHWKTFALGDNSGVLSPNFKFSKRQKKVFEASLDRVYEDFTTKVMQARRLDKTQINAVARGRVWSGADAKEVGLVDEIGGFLDTLEALRKTIKADENEKVMLLFYPKPKSMQEKIAELFSSAPMVMTERLKTQIGLDKNLMSMLQRLQYDAVMVPFVIRD